MSIANFQIRQGATVPFLDVAITKDGKLSLFPLAPKFSCAAESSDSNAVDLSDVQSVTFQMGKCSRNGPQWQTMYGRVEILNHKAGLVRYYWHPNDTVQQGCYYGTFIITFRNGYVYKFPLQVEALSIEVI